MKRLSTALAIVAVAGSAAIATAAAGTLTDLMQSSRMTVMQVDRASGQVLCAEHRRWTAVARADLADVNAGDIVRIDRGDGRAHLTLLRTAADEMSTPER